MGCQSEVYIGDYLTFSIATHDPDTGALTDADAEPAYRIYEDETAGAILNGTMSLLDAGNTDGFYTERIHCSVANGFEDRKSYTIYIRAVVDLDPGGIALSFRALTAPNNLSAANVTALVAAALAAYDGPTDAEMLAAFAALENLSAAQVNAQVAGALAAYDGPTDAEMLIALAALNDVSAAQVNAQVVDALNADTYAEPGQGAPSATATLAVKIGYLYKAFRNRLTQTATELNIYNDAGDTVDQKAPVSYDGTTYTRGKIGSGP